MCRVAAMYVPGTGTRIRTICDNRGNLVCKDHCNQETQCQNCIPADTEEV
jgi:hypothetical protein